MLPDWMEEELKKADLLAIQARRAAISGQPRRAENLRDRHDSIFARLFRRLENSEGRKGKPENEQ